MFRMSAQHVRLLQTRGSWEERWELTASFGKSRGGSGVCVRISSSDSGSLTTMSIEEEEATSSG